VTVEGAEFGIACNVCHYVDLCCWLNRFSGAELVFSTAKLDAGGKPSKRAGCVLLFPGSTILFIFSHSAMFWGLKRQDRSYFSDDFSSHLWFGRYTEVYGTFEGAVEGETVLSVKSWEAEDRKPNTLTITTPTLELKLCGCDVTVATDGGAPVAERAAYQHVSKLTGVAIEQLVQREPCLLPSFATVRVYHVPVIEALTRHFAEAGIDGCPIT
jgi:hypothetical protein